MHTARICNTPLRFFSTVLWLSPEHTSRTFIAPLHTPPLLLYSHYRAIDRIRKIMSLYPTTAWREIIDERGTPREDFPCITDRPPSSGALERRENVRSAIRTKPGVIFSVFRCARKIARRPYEAPINRHSVHETSSPGTVATRREEGDRPRFSRTINHLGALVL